MSRAYVRSTAAAVAACVMMLCGVAAAHAATYNVSTTLDFDNGACTAGDCTLREAINAANASGEPDTIHLAAGVYALSVAGTDEDSNVNGDLDVASQASSGTLTILGVGMNKTSITGNAAGERVFHGQTSNLYVSDLTISGGNSVSQSSPQGGGIYMASGGTLTLVRVRMTDNTASGAGGGAIFVESSASLIMQFARIDNNQASAGDGGGVRVDSGSIATIGESEFSSNSAFGNGGGVAVEGSTASASFYDSTLHANAANVNGGGLYLNSNSTATLFNVTLTSNIADQNNDSAGDGGGFYQSAATSLITLANSLLANNVRVPSGTASNCAEDLTVPPSSLGHNLVANTSGCTLAWIGSDMLGVNPKLGTYGFHGGLTQTHPIRLSSPARNRGSATNCSSRTYDQRGFRRAVGSSCDIGAYELGARADIGFSSRRSNYVRTYAVTPGVSRTIKLRIFNKGFDPAVGINFTLRLPAGVTVRKASSAVSCSGTKTVRCTVRGAGVDVGGVLSVNMKFTSTSTEPKVVRGRLNHAGVDPKSGNNIARITLT